MHLTGADMQYIDTYWHWATHKDAKAAGPEYSSLHSVKFQKQGQRFVLMSPFSQLETFSKGTVGSGGALTMARIVEMSSEADEQMVEALIKAKVPLVHGVIPGGMGLFVPRMDLGRT